MSDGQLFDFSGLFSRTIPSELGSRQAHRRPRYDFGVAYPDPDSLPLDELAESLKEALREEGRDLAVYPHLQGYPPLREFVAGKIAEERNIRVSADDIFLGDGSSQPNHMIAEALINPGDVVLTEAFTYAGTLHILHRFRADIRGVSCDDEGMLPGAVEDAIREANAQGKRVKAIYTIPTFQNPLGFVMTLERRQALVRLSQRYDVPIWEDDCYVDLRYDGEPVTSIRSLDETGRTIYVASFSKIIGPGMRIGYLTASPQVLDRMAAIKSGGGVNQFTAFAVHRYSIAHLKQHIDDARHALRIKRDAMLRALEDHFGATATWTRPTGGLFIWLQMPEGVDTSAAHGEALEADVVYTPGPNTATDGVSGRNCVRLCFGFNRPDEIGEGIARLAEVFERQAVLTS
jgi:2-aminoadipate transaminase